ncbi:MAG: preprotein translocase subunit SecE [Candidatus Acidiferrales bacterium]
MEDQHSVAGKFEVPGPLARIVEYPRRLRQFLHDVRVEMRQVNWPTWTDVKSTTTVVVVTVTFFALFFLCTDWVFQHLESWTWNYFSK